MQTLRWFRRNRGRARRQRGATAAGLPCRFPPCVQCSKSRDGARREPSLAPPELSRSLGDPPGARAREPLLVAQGLNRVESCGAARGPEAEEQADAGGESECQKE